MASMAGFFITLVDVYALLNLWTCHVKRFSRANPTMAPQNSQGMATQGSEELSNVRETQVIVRRLTYLGEILDGCYSVDSCFGRFRCPRGEAKLLGT